MDSLLRYLAVIEQGKPGMSMELTRERYGYFLKDTIPMTCEFSITDRSRGMEPPSRRIGLGPPAILCQNKT